MIMFYDLLHNKYDIKLKIKCYSYMNHFGTIVYYFINKFLLIWLYSGDKVTFLIWLTRKHTYVPVKLYQETYVYVYCELTSVCKCIC